MYLILRSNGVYYVEYSDNENRKKRVSTGTRNRAQAERFLDVFSNNKIETTTISKPIKYQELVGKFFTEYQTYIDAFKSSKYSRSVQSTKELFVKSYSTREFDSFTTRELEHFLIQIYKISPYSAFSHFRNLRAAFNKGIEWGYVEANPFTKIKLPKIPRVIPKFIGETELELIMQNSRSDVYGKLFMFAYYTGMRRGEILNLRWKDICIMDGTIHIKNNKEFSTKNKKDRIIPMHPKIKAIISELDKDEEKLVFRKTNGFPLNKDVVTANFKYAVRESKLDDRIHFHSLRHSFASNLVKKGISLVVIKELLGHEDIATTMIYSHVNYSVKCEAINLL